MKSHLITLTLLLTIGLVTTGFANTPHGSHEAANARERSSKFAESTFTLAYTGRSTFFGGLEALIGTPSPNLRVAMEAEHCASPDSQDEFTTANYGIHTRSDIEWYFVVDPDAGLEALGLTDKSGVQGLARQIVHVAAGSRTDVFAHQLGVLFVG